MASAWRDRVRAAKRSSNSLIGPSPLLSVLTSRRPWRAIRATSRRWTPRQRSRYSPVTARGPPWMARGASDPNGSPPPRLPLGPAHPAVPRVPGPERQLDGRIAQAGGVDRRGELERRAGLLARRWQGRVRLQRVEHRVQERRVVAGGLRGIRHGLDRGAPALGAVVAVEGLERPGAVGRPAGADDLEARGRAMCRHRGLGADQGAVREADHGGAGVVGGEGAVERVQGQQAGARGAEGVAHEAVVVDEWGHSGASAGRGPGPPPARAVGLAWAAEAGVAE